MSTGNRTLTLLGRSSQSLISVHLSDSGTHVSRGLFNFSSFPKPYTSSTRPASLCAPRPTPLPLFLSLLHTYFSILSTNIRSQVTILPFPEFTGILPTRQEDDVSLTHYLYIPRKAKAMPGCPPAVFSKYHSCFPGGPIRPPH